MSSAANYCLKDPSGQVIGFRLGADELGHEIYDLLDWADEHFPSYFVEQDGGQVHICSEEAREVLAADEVHAEPLSLDGGSQGGRPGGGPAEGGPSGGGFAGDGSGSGNSGTGGGGTAVEPEV